MIDNGGSKLLDNIEFTKEFDPFIENCTTQFLIDSIEKELFDKMKPREVYEAKLKELQVNSLKNFNLLNLHRIHLNEVDILQKNLDYLKKLK